MRFAFYGRMSTEDQQDPASSRGWQLARSRQVIEPAGGEIACEFVDVGQSQSLPWKRRPESARLLESFKDPNHGFDAVVIGEPQRAFYGNQFGLTFPVLVHSASSSGCPKSVAPSWIQAPKRTISSCSSGVASQPRRTPSVQGLDRGA